MIDLYKIVEVVRIKVLVVGGTGFIGKQLIHELLANKYQVVILTRNKAKAEKEFGKEVEVAEWDSSLIVLPSKELEQVDAIVNLAGESIGSGRWSNSKKEKIINSRISTTKAIIEAINDKVLKPSVLVNASAIGYYGPDEEKEFTEEDSPGEDFLAEVSKAWEEQALKAKDYDVRVVTLRIGFVLGNGGALKQMITPFKFYMGGPIGSGNQWISWIHVRDLIGIIKFAIDHNDIEGPINCTSPNPVTMQELSKAIGKVLHRPSWLRVPTGPLRFVLGEMADLLVNGQKVTPKKLTTEGYKYKYSKLNKALEDILS